MSNRPTHLVCLFLVTAGQHDEHLGADEEQIVEFVYLLYDLTNNKVGSYVLFKKLFLISTCRRIVNFCQVDDIIICF